MSRPQLKVRYDWLSCVDADHDWFMGDMAEYPKLQYSMKAVRRAGKRLAEEILWDESGRDEIIEIFRIANSWRDSHVFPMKSVRYSVLQRMRRMRIGGFTSARPKRMPSIRRKLQRLPVQLEQINDLGGCRAVLDDMASVSALIDECRDQFPHEIRKEWPYITEPKEDGYRSHHIVFNYHGAGEREIYNGRRVELQIRTRLQHSWATAVEAVGLYRGEDMKGGMGDSNWLRLFQLMSEEFARAEHCRDFETEFQRSERVQEIIKLNKDLRAVGTLEDLRAATHYLKEFIHEPSRYYLIRYDQKNHVVEVKPYFSALAGTASLGEVEQEIVSRDADTKVVLVEVEKVEGLVEAYPNYFGDVTLFVQNLKSICEGKSAIEYSMAPREMVAPRPEEVSDPRWLIPRRYRRWTEERRVLSRRKAKQKR